MSTKGSPRETSCDEFVGLIYPILGTSLVLRAGGNSAVLLGYWAVLLGADVGSVTFVGAVALGVGRGLVVLGVGSGLAVTLVGAVVFLAGSGTVVVFTG